MPTAKPRITITLSDHQHAVLEALSELQKVSMSSIVVELLETTMPVLERLSSILENAANAPQSVLDELRRSAEHAEADVIGMGSPVLEHLDFLVAASSGVAGAAATVAPSGAAAGKPPSTNRGVRIKSPRSKIEQISPMKTGEKNGRAKK